MKISSRVVWNEGMHLAQHHFQAQGRYVESSVAFALSDLYFEPFGLIGCELDAEALRNGTASLVHARGLLPDGLAFNFPDGDPLPTSLDIGPLFSPTQDSHLLHLAIPPYRRGQANCDLAATNGGEDVRYLAHTDSVPDDITGQDERSITLGRKNFRLVLDSALEESDLVSLAIARIRRDGAGHFIYDPDYIPPCLQIGGSTRLLELLGRLVDMLEAKGTALTNARRRAGKSLAEYASHEVANFWLTHAIHSNLAPLKHHLETRRSHPEQLFTDLSRLAGALCTFSLDADASALPTYDHGKLDECFNALDRHIRRHLDVVIPTDSLTIPLRSTAEYLWTGNVPDKRCFTRAKWFLGIRSGASTADVVARVPGLVKICSAEHIVRLVQEAHAGLPMTHQPAPPSALSPRVGTSYFLIDMSGPCAQLMERTMGVGIYVPAAIPEAELDLQIVIDRSKRR